MPRRTSHPEAGRWSASHRKTAILGWIAFVVLAFAMMPARSSKQTSSLGRPDRRRVRRRRADPRRRRHAPDRRDGPDPEQELEVGDPRFDAAVDETAAARSSTVDGVSRRRLSPSARRGGRCPERRPLGFVEFEIAGRAGDVKAHRRPSSLDRSATSAAQRAQPRVHGRQFGGRQRQQSDRDALAADVGKAGMLSLPITLLVLLIALGALVAASVPLVLALTSVLATMASDRSIPSQVFPLGGNTDAPDPPDRARGRGRLLAVLHAPPARGAGRRSHHAAALDAAAATSGRAVLISGLTVIIAMAGMFITGERRSSHSRRDAPSSSSSRCSRRWRSCRRCFAGSATGSKRVGSRSPAGAARKAQFALWSAIVTRVMRRPVVSIVVAGGFLVALAIPALSMNVVPAGPDAAAGHPGDRRRTTALTAAFPTRPTRPPSSSRPTTCPAARSAPRHRRSGQRGAHSSRTVRRPARRSTYSDDGTVATVDPDPGQRHRRRVDGGAGQDPRRDRPRHRRRVDDASPVTGGAASRATSPTSSTARCRSCSRSCSAWRSC